MRNLEETFEYDNQNRLKRVRLGPTLTGASVYDGYDRQRIFMEEHAGNRLRTKITGPTGVYAVVVTENGRDKIHYIMKDNLGSWTTVADEEGSVEQQLSYDAWGSLRDPNTWSGNFTGVPLFDRGFTGHEHLTAFGLINMNGRMYDPKMSSFLSADRYVSNPLTTQGFNRYAYCLNNPLRYTDPSGWLPGRTPDGPLRRVVIGGETTFILPEVVVLGDNPSLANYITYEEFWYTPNLTGGGRNLQGNNVNPSTSIGPRGGTGGGNHIEWGIRIKNRFKSEIQQTIISVKTQYEFSNFVLGLKISSYAGSDFNQRMFLNYWNGLGDYELSTSEFTDIVSLSRQTNEPYLSEWNGDPALAVPVTFYGTPYANAIGTTTLFYDLNGNAIGIHELYDFNLFPIRDSWSAQIKTTLVWSASLYNVHDKVFYINYNYHP